MSGAVGSTPSFTRKGLAVLADFSSLVWGSASRIISALHLFERASCSATGWNVVVVIDCCGGSPVSRLVSQLNYAPSFDFETAIENNFYRLGIDLMFFAQN